VADVSRPLRTGLPVLATLAVAAAAVSGFALPASARELAPAIHAASAAHLARTAHGAGRTTATRAAEWWLPALGVAAAWHAAPGEGKGVTVAVLSTGVDATHPDLAGTVTTGPNFANTSRKPGQQYWAAEGTAVASLIAGHGHGHGTGGDDGISGIAPGARILSVQVTLEYDDPLNSDATVTSRLPDAIAAGIRYAVGHGATVIALPLDPGTLDTSHGNRAAAGGSRAEQSAVEYAISHDVLLIAPAGDNGADANTVNYPAAYPGVIAVSATSRNGQLTPFSNTGSYVALTAPGGDRAPTTSMDPAAGETGLTVAAPGGGYETLASTDMSAALTTGVAALIRGRYPSLTAAEVTQAIEGGATAPRSGGKGGRGHGALNAANALTKAATIAAAHQKPRSTRPASPLTVARPAPGRRAASAKPNSGTLVRSVLLDMVVAAGVLIAGLIGALAVTGLRRRRRSARSAGSARPGHGRARARHSRANPPAAPTDEHSQGTVWPTAPARPAIGAGNVNDNDNSAWSVATPTTRPATSQAADAPLAPWEESPSTFAIAPVPKAPPPWPLSSSGPMYVWNPDATTGPLHILDEDAGNS